MKHLILTLSLMASPAFADGFICTSNDGSLNVKAYNHVNAAQGTRTSAALVVSDNNAQVGHKTLARFDANDSLLQNVGASYRGKVDLRSSNISDKGAVIGNTTIGNLWEIQLIVGFNYARPVENGADLQGSLTLALRDGTTSVMPMSCTRYLKN